MDVGRFDALRETKAAYYKGEFEKVKHDPKQAWKTVNKILNRKQESREINCLETQRVCLCTAD